MLISFSAKKNPGGLIIGISRLTLAILILVVVFGVLLRRLLHGDAPLEIGYFVGPALFFIHALISLFLSGRRDFKGNGYIAALDMILLGLCIYFSGQSFAPAVSWFYFFAFIIFVPVWALSGEFSTIFCAAGFAAVCYLIPAIAFRGALGRDFGMAIFRSIIIAITGGVPALSAWNYHCLIRELKHKGNIAEESSSRFISRTKDVAKTIQDSAMEISVSSKDSFASANNQAASMEEIKSTINENVQIAVEISEKTGSVANIASKMENDVQTGFSVLEKNVAKMGDIKEKNSGVINGILALGNKINKIRDIVRVINTITDQTKVIAFNAALEAASAGETGKRFAVVAAEVNHLADDIAELTRQIREQVEEIQSSSSSLIISSEEGSDRIAEGYKLIKDLEDIFKEIRSGAEITANQAQTITVSTQKQRKSSEQVNIAITDVSSGLQNFIKTAQAATASAEALALISRDLETLLVNQESHGN